MNSIENPVVRERNLLNNLYNIIYKLLLYRTKTKEKKMKNDENRHHIYASIELTQFSKIFLSFESVNSSS